jgi:rhodanese-related sulfurtransferase
MLAHEPRRSALHRPPPVVEASGLIQHLWSVSPPDILDVREEAFYRAGHIEGAVNTPESNTVGLVQKVKMSHRVILVCDDGRLSSTVARMLGVCGFRDVAFLKGGLRAWTDRGEHLMETTRSGEERRAQAGGDPDAPSAVWRVLSLLTPSVVMVGIVVGAALAGGLAILMNR